MAALKTYIMELSERLGKEFGEIDTDDIQTDLYTRSQEVFSQGAITQKELDDMIQFLPTITSAECGGIAGEVYQDMSGTFFLVV